MNFDIINSIIASLDFKVQGNTYSDAEFKYFQVAILKCDSSVSTWQSDADIDAEITNVSIDMAVVNTYFDFDDYENPIKTYLDDRFLFDLLPGYSYISDVFLQNNQAELQDGFFYYTPDGDEVEFIGFDRISTKYKVYDIDNSPTLFCK